MNGDSTNHSEDQKNGRNSEEHAHLRIGFHELTRHRDLGPPTRPRADVRMQTADCSPVRPVIQRLQPAETVYLSAVANLIQGRDE